MSLTMRQKGLKAARVRDFQPLFSLYISLLAGKPPSWMGRVRRSGMARATLAVLVSLCFVYPAISQTDTAKPVDIGKEMRSISTPNALNTRIGPLQFNDGRPVPKTVEQLYDHLDFVRGVDVFLNAMPGASLVAMRRAQRGMGAADNSFVMFEHYLELEDARADGQHREPVCVRILRSHRRPAGAGISAERAGRAGRHVVPPHRRLRDHRPRQGQGRKTADRAARLQG